MSKATDIFGISISNGLHTLFDLGNYSAEILVFLLLLFTIYRITQNEDRLKSAHGKEREYVKRLSAVHDHAEQLYTATRREEVLTNSLDIIDGVLGYGKITFWMPEGEDLVIQGYRGTPPNISRLEINGSGIIARAFRNGKSENIGNVMKDADYVEGYLSISSELTVPVIMDDEVLGVLNIENNRPNYYKDDDVHLFETLALHIAWALERIRSKEQQENMLQ